MLFKSLATFVVLHLVSASLEKDSDATAVLQHERAPIPGALVPLPEISASTKGLHLSVTTGTPGVWYPSTGAPFNAQSLLTYWTASDSSGQFPSAASENGSVYVSDDYGVNWSARGASRAHTSITSDASGNRLAVTVNNEGVYLSSDRGITWSLANIPGASNYLWAALTSDFSGQHLTAVGFVHFGEAVIYHSHDFGVTWATAVDTCFYREILPSVAMSHDGQYQYVGVEWCGYRTADYGVTWTQLSTAVNTIACNGSGQKVVVVGHSGSSIMGSTDYGVTWTQFNHPTGDYWVTFSSIVMDTSGLNIVVGGLSLRAVIASADGGATWSYITPKGGLFATTFPHRMVGDAAAKHLLIAQGLKTTVNPLVTAFLPESVPTAKPTGHGPLGFDSSANLTVKSFASVKDAQFFLVPANVTSIKVSLYAASGANYSSTWYSGRVGRPGKGGMISSFVPVTTGEVLMVMVGSTGTLDESGYNGVDAYGGDGGLNPTGGIPTVLEYVQDDYASPGGTHLQEPTCAINNPGPLGQGCDGSSGGGGGYYGGGVSWRTESGGGGGSSFSLYTVVDEATGANSGDGYAVLEYTWIPYHATAYILKNSNTAAAELHKRALVPGARIPQPAVATASKGLHLSVTTGTPGVWYPGSGAPMDPKKPISYWTASDSSGQFPSAASENGTVYVSDDYGVTWSARGASRAHTSITSDASGNRLAVAVTKEGVYLSSDRGITWTLASIPDASNYMWARVVSDYSGQHLTAVGSLAQYGQARTYYSHDFGLTWAATETDCWYSSYDPPSVTISQDGQYQFMSFVWCTLRSTDYGATWTQLGTYTRLTACNGTGQNVVAVNYDASVIMGSTDYGVTWVNFDTSIGNGMSYSSIVIDTSGLNIVVGLSNPRAVIGSADGGATWSFITPVGGLFETTFPFRMVADAAAKHLLIAQDLKTTVNPLVTAFLPESVPTAKPTGAAPLGYDSSPANLTVKSYASVKDAQFFLVP
eukprot:gene13831-15906_t